MTHALIHTICCVLLPRLVLMSSALDGYQNGRSSWGRLEPTSVQVEPCQCAVWVFLRASSGTRRGFQNQSACNEKLHQRRCFAPSRDSQRAGTKWLFIRLPFAFALQLGDRERAACIRRISNSFKMQCNGLKSFRGCSVHLRLHPWKLVRWTCLD